MLRKLKIAKRGCDIAWIFLAIQIGAVAVGQNAKSEFVMLFLLIFIVLIVVESKIRKCIRQIELEEHQKKPVCTTRATVLKQKVRYYYIPAGKYGVRSGTPMHCILFETEKGIKIEFHVPQDTYFSVQEGKCGYLKYKGNEFISFN